MMKGLRKAAVLTVLAVSCASCAVPAGAKSKNLGGKNASFRRDCTRSGHNYTTIINNYRKDKKGQKTLVSRYKKCGSCGHKERFYP